MESEIEGLEREIAALQSRIDQARNELYLLHVQYAAQHFQTQSIMRAGTIEALHRSGAQAEADVIERRCLQLEAAIARHKEVLSTLEPDAS